MEQNKETATQNKQREAEVCREKKQTAWDKWKDDTLRKFNRTCMTEAYTVGISETHIRNNATVFRVWQMIERGELTREEGLYLMVNTLADENHRLNQMCNDLIMRMPSRLLVETITGKN